MYRYLYAYAGTCPAVACNGIPVPGAHPPRSPSLLSHMHGDQDVRGGHANSTKEEYDEEVEHCMENRGPALQLLEAVEDALEAVGHAVAAEGGADAAHGLAGHLVALLRRQGEGA